MNQKRRRKETTKNEMEQMGKKASKMVYINPAVSIITLNVNDLSIPTS